MLASGRPVLATAHDGTQLARVVRGLGTVVTPGDLDAFVSALVELAADKDLRLMLGQEARRYALTHLDSLMILEQFEQSLIAVCGISEAYSKNELAQSGANDTPPRDLRTNFVEPPSTLEVTNSRKPCV
jgi:colanic acid biosynthesis glycosyl transferase WcaI